MTLQVSVGDETVASAPSASATASASRNGWCASGETRTHGENDEHHGGERNVMAPATMRPRPAALAPQHLGGELAATANAISDSARSQSAQAPDLVGVHQPQPRRTATRPVTR